MDNDILQSTLDNLFHLLINPSQITLEGATEIGVGGYGRVFLATLESSDSQIKVAVKQLRIVQAIEDRRRVAIRLARELKVWAKAKHPNILELLGFYHTEDYICAQFVSAHMANGNVKQYINKFKPNVATRLRFIQGITSGMSYLHSCNPAICHGDLKPTNVLVNESLDAVLCDFGLATFIMESGVSSGLTTSKSVKGSTRYMAPELLLENEARQTLKSDVWAWASTTFEVLTDCEPFPDAKGDGPVITALILGRPPGSVELLDRLVSDSHITYRLTLDSLKSIIPQCWIMDSTQRPSSSEILDRLISPDGIEALNIATASSHLSATQGLQPEPFSLPRTDLPMHTDVKKKRKGSLGLEGRLEKRARGKDATIKTVPTEAVRMQKGYGEGAILMTGHTSRVRVCRWNPLKRDVLATGSADSEVRLQNLLAPPALPFGPLAGKHHSGSAGNCYIMNMEWDCTGARLATACNHGVLRVWTAEGVLQSNLEFHTDAILSIMWSPSALFLLSTDGDGTVVVWDMRTSKMDKIYQVFRFHSGALALHVDADRGRELADSVYVALWFDDEFLISCGIDGQIHICRLQKETPLRTLIGDERAITLLSLSKDKTLLASSSYDLAIRVWNLTAIEAASPAQSATGETDPAQKWVLRGQTGEASSLGWCPSLDPAMQYLLVS
ncbi:hypothetical protein FRC05_003862 [Tulasnella sp. 425]|nr:hypothetical protein FRC05_003862 [Tulasnella sp. 425]